MLKFRIDKKYNEVHRKEIQYDYNSLYAPEDLSYVSGYFDADEQVGDGDIVSITSTNANGFVDLPIQITNITRIGEFQKNIDSPIQEVSQFVTYDGDTKDVTLYAYAYDTNKEYSVTTSAVTYNASNFYKLTKRYIKAPNGKIYYEVYDSPDFSSDDTTTNGELIYSYWQYYKVEKVENGKLTLIYPENLGVLQTRKGFFDLESYGRFYTDATYEQVSTDTSTSSLILTQNYYIDNGYITYDGVDYSFEDNYVFTDTDATKKSINITTEEGETFTSNINEYDTPLKLSKFTLNTQTRTSIDVDSMTTAEKYYFITYKGNKYDLKFVNGKWQVTVVNDYNQFETFFYDGELEINSNIANYFSTYAYSMNINGIDYPIETDYRTTRNGNYLFLYTTQPYDLLGANYTTLEAEYKVEDNSSYNILEDGEGRYYINYFEKRYYLADTFGSSANTKYVFTISKYLDKTNIDGTQSNPKEDVILDEFEVKLVGGDESYLNFFINGVDGVSLVAKYIDDDGNETRWSVQRGDENENGRDRAYKIGNIIEYDGTNVTSVKQSASTVTEKYKFNAYRYTMIDGIKCRANISNRLYKYNPEDTYVINVNEHYDTCELQIVSNDSNWIICQPIIDYNRYLSENELLDTSIDFSDDINGLITRLTKPYREYIDIIINNESLFYVKNTLFGYSNEPVVENSMGNVLDLGFWHLYKKINYFSFPLDFTASNALNLRQEEIVNNDFFNVEKEKAINRIVDMEKDIYYPVINNGKTLKNVNKIIFNLHLRTREMEEWTINDSYKDEELSDNWFAFDSYNRTNLESEEIASGDLLHFLNFTENDVFYQKNRLSKTFLRVSYYDSMDEQSQNLLATSTVFFDETRAYKNYILNVNDKNYKLYYKLDGNGTFCNVNTEPVKEGSTEIDYSQARLDASFEITNRAETTNSSEGFYIYMFKEYGLKYRPNDIYMKVELNHAGEGKTLQFFMPVRDGDGKLSYMAKASNNSKEITTLTLDEMEDGIPLNEISKAQYIKLTVKFDPDSNKYVYYLPSDYPQDANNWLKKGENTMIFNLWEIKIKNEL